MHFTSWRTLIQMATAVSSTPTRLSIIGLGYIGLPTAALFACKTNLKVTGVDIASRIVEAVNAGAAHFTEHGLDALVSEAVEKGSLRATCVPEPADAFIIAVPTPVHRAPTSNGLPPNVTADLTCVQEAAGAIAAVLKAGDMVILESTVPVGTTQRLAGWLAAARPDLHFGGDHEPHAMVHIAHCPERVLPGRMLQELVENDRIIGGVTPLAARKAADLYGQILDGGRCILASNARTAELCKLAENSFRDCNIAFANELSMVCDQLGDINVWELVRLANMHPRVSILQPGPGVGGHCIAVDPWFVIESVTATGVEATRLIRTARLVNEAKHEWVVAELKTLVFDALTDKTGQVGTTDGVAAVEVTLADVVIACLGLAYKQDVGDLRESPALEVARRAAGWGCRILAVEPNLSALPPNLTDTSRLNVQLVSLSEALEVADVVCILVAHKEFVDPSAKKAIKTGHAHRIMDTVGIFG